MRARMLAVWLFFKNSGQCVPPLSIYKSSRAHLFTCRIIAGAINLATNVKNAKGGKGALVPLLAPTTRP